MRDLHFKGQSRCIAPTLSFADSERNVLVNKYMVLLFLPIFLKNLQVFFVVIKGYMVFSIIIIALILVDNLMQR